MQHRHIATPKEFTHSRAHIYEREEPIKSYNNNNIHNENEDENENEEKNLSTGENIIVQCIASGVIIILVLLISLVDIPPAIAIQNGIRFALTGANTPTELIYNVQEFRENWINWEGIQFTPVPGYPAVEPPFYPNPIYPNAQPNLDYLDIEYYNMTTEGEDSNPQIPESSVVLELWD